MRAWGLWYGQGLVNGTCDLPVVGSAGLCEDLTGDCETHIPRTQESPHTHCAAAPQGLPEGTSAGQQEA